jgi:hypothetical protein
MDELMALQPKHKKLFSIVAQAVSASRARGVGSATVDFAKQHCLKRIFDLVDTDRSGYISLQELTQALRAMSINISDERALQLFCRCDKDNSGLLDFREFESALEKIREDFVRSLLQGVGMNRFALFILLLLLVSVLLGLLVFIFLGVKAFGVGDEFAAIINSILPLSTGLFMGFATNLGLEDAEKTLKRATKRIEETVRTMAAAI